MGTNQVCQIKPEGYSHIKEEETSEIQEVCVQLMIQVGTDWVAGTTDISRLQEHRDSLLQAHGLVSLTQQRSNSSNSSKAQDVPKPAATEAIVPPPLKRCTVKQKPAAVKRAAKTKAPPPKPAQQQQQLQNTADVQPEYTPPTTMAQLGIAKPSFLGVWTSDSD